MWKYLGPASKWGSFASWRKELRSKLKQNEIRLIQGDTLSIGRMWTFSEGERTQGMELLVVMGSVISFNNKWEKYICYSREGTGIFKNWTTVHFWNGSGPYGPCPPCPLPAFCLWKNFSQRIRLIREVRICRNKRKQSKETNNNNGVIQHS